MYTTLAMIDWTDALKDRIVKGLEEQSLRKLCAANPDLPSRDAITERMKRDDNFAARCARAREEHAEFMDDRILEIAQKVENGELDAKAGSVIISAFQWRAAKLKPKKYGDKMEIEHRVDRVILPANPKLEIETGPKELLPEWVDGDE